MKSKEKRFFRRNTNRSALHGANGVAVRKPVGGPKQELIDVQTVMNK